MIKTAEFIEAELFVIDSQLAGLGIDSNEVSKAHININDISLFYEDGKNTCIILKNGKELILNESYDDFTKRQI